MRSFQAILRRYLVWLGVLVMAAGTVACGGPRAGAKKRRKVRMPCPCNLGPHFPVYLAYASQKERKWATSPSRAYQPYDDSGGVCRWTDR